MPTTLNLTGDDAIYAGDGYVLSLPLVDAAGAPFDPTGMTFAAQIRATPSASAAAAEFAADVDGNVLTLTLTGAETAALAEVVSSGVWDLEVVEAGFEPETWLRGVVAVEMDVTR